MKSRDSSKGTQLAFYESPIDVPSLLIMAAWVSLWLLWPTGNVHVEHPRVPSTMDVRYQGVSGQGGKTYRQPILFASPMQPRMDFPKSAFADLPSLAVKQRAMPLGRVKIPHAPVTIEHDDPLAGRALRSLAGYAPEWDAVPAFLRSSTEPPLLVVRISRELKRAGFQLPVLSQEAFTNGKSWEVTLFIECDNDGAVRHVFVERGSGDATVDAQICKAMYQAQAAERADAVTGRVTLSFGKQ